MEHDHLIKWEEHVSYAAFTAIMLLGAFGVRFFPVFWFFAAYALYRFVRWAYLGFTCLLCLSKFVVVAIATAFVGFLLFFDLPPVYYTAGIFLAAGHWWVRFGRPLLKGKKRKRRPPRRMPEHPDAPFTS